MNENAPAARIIRDAALRRFLYIVAGALCVLMGARGWLTGDDVQTAQTILALVFGVAAANVPGGGHAES